MIDDEDSLGAVFDDITATPSREVCVLNVTKVQSEASQSSRDAAFSSENSNMHTRHHQRTSMAIVGNTGILDQNEMGLVGTYTRQGSGEIFPVTSTGPGNMQATSSALGSRTIVPGISFDTKTLALPHCLPEGKKTHFFVSHKKVCPCAGRGGERMRKKGRKKREGQRGTETKRDRKRERERERKREREKEKPQERNKLTPLLSLPHSAPPHPSNTLALATRQRTSRCR